MEINDQHKAILRGMGLSEKDFALFDGKFVTYEYDDEKGVRIYDPYYSTSYNEYIGVEGWSAWSSEKDTFMSDILRGARKKVVEAEAAGKKLPPEELRDAMAKKFAGKKP